VEVDPSQMGRALAIREKLLSEGLSRGYQRVLLDLAGYLTGGANLRQEIP
jgi:PP-loop superfamily ATP-utilizing enzyme